MNSGTHIKTVLLLPGACSGLIAPSALAQDGTSFIGTLQNVTASIRTFCANSQVEETFIASAPAAVRGFRACNDSSVEVTVSGGFPATTPLAQLSTDGQGYKLIFSSSIPTAATLRAVLTTADVPPQNKGGFVVLTVPFEDNPDSLNSKEYGGHCADLSTTIAAFQGTQERSLTQSGCQRATKWTGISTKIVGGTTVPDLISVTTYADAGITDSRLPKVHIELDAFYKMDVDCGAGVKGATGCTPPDLAIGGIVAVQSVQHLNNPLPLVPGKATLVRVFLESRGENAKNITEVSGTLTADQFKDSKPQLPINNGSAFATPEPNPDVKQHSLNFLLPEEWTQSPSLDLTATVKFKGQTNPTENNTKRFTIRFDPTLNENLIVDALIYASRWPESWNAPRLQTLPTLLPAPLSRSVRTTLSSFRGGFLEVGSSGPDRCRILVRVRNIRFEL